MAKAKKPKPVVLKLKYDFDLVSKDPLEVLLLSSDLDYKFGKVTRYNMVHVDLAKDIDLVESSEDDVITKFKPKLVIAIKKKSEKEDKETKEKEPKKALANSFTALETMCGNEVAICDFQLLPTKYKDHKFWLMAIPDYNVKVNLLQYKDLIAKAMVTPPEVWEGTYEGVEFVTKNEDIEPAFAYLRQQEYVGFDIETNGLVCYKKDSKMLSIAFSDGIRTFVFPLFHPQTPTGFDVQQVLLNLFTFKKTKLIAHNLAFELEWLANFLGEEFLYCNEFQDTQAQTYILSKKNRKALNMCVRRFFGFNLKAISDIEIDKLEETPLDQVLYYNSLDAKYTALLFPRQAKLVNDQNMQESYKLQIERIPSVVLMQMKGLIVDNEFVLEQILKELPIINALTDEFNTYEEVIRQNKTWGSCNPMSDNKDIPRLFREELGISYQQPTFNKEFLATLDHPLAKTLASLRDHQHIVSTNLLPFTKDVEDGGDNIQDDGLIHTTFNTMNTATHRLSSNNPNMQNEPKRGGKVYLRNKITAPPEYIILSVDQAQIEARLAASFSGDEGLINDIKTGYDTHMVWAKRIIEYIPEFFVTTDVMICTKEDKSKKCECFTCQLKDFRGRVKNEFFFPLIYGSSRSSVCRNLSLPDKLWNRFMPIFDEYWKKYSAVKKWQESAKQEHTDFGYVSGPFGRKHFGPLTWNAIINYPVQGAASDILVISMDKLAKMSVTEKIPDLCPRINVHDELDFYIREDLFEDLLPIILGTMLEVDAYKDWLKVPLEVEASTGHSWGQVEGIGKYSSDTFNSLLAMK